MSTHMPTLISNEIDLESLTTFPVLEILLSNISPDVFQNIRKYDPKGIATLAASIKSTGLDTPLLIAELNPDNEKEAAALKEGFLYGLVDGFRRWAALMKLIKDGTNINAVMAKIVPNDLKTRLIKANTANHQREGMDYIATAINIKAMQDQGMKLAEISTAVGHPGPWCSSAASMLTLRPEIQEKISNGMIPWRAARVLPALDEKEQDALVARIEAIFEGTDTTGDTAADAADRAMRTRRVKKSNRGRRSGADSETPEGSTGKKPLTGKKAIALVEEQVVALKEAAKGATEATPDDATIEHHKQAAALLALVSKFLSNKLGIQAFGKKLVKYAAGEGL